MENKESFFQRLWNKYIKPEEKPKPEKPKPKPKTSKSKPRRKKPSTNLKS